MSAQNHKVGDMIVIRKDLKRTEALAFNVTHAMLIYAGTPSTIKKVIGGVRPHYKLSIGTSEIENFCWTDEMFEDGPPQKDIIGPDAHKEVALLMLEWLTGLDGVDTLIEEAKLDIMAYGEIQDSHDWDKRMAAAIDARCKKKD